MEEITPERARELTYQALRAAARRAELNAASRRYTGPRFEQIRAEHRRDARAHVSPARTALWI